MIAWFFASVITFSICALIAIYQRRTRCVSARDTIWLLVGGTFVSLWLLYFPLSLHQYQNVYPQKGWGTHLLLSFFQSIQNSLRTFILDGAWPELFNLYPDIPAQYTALGLILSVVAPVLTFTTVLSFFKNTWANIRFRGMTVERDPLYIMSELNDNTLALANDIRTNMRSANIVFTDVFPTDDEQNFELREEANKVGAVLLRTDITELKVQKRKADTEYFLLGHDEAENVTQTLKLINKNSARKRVRIVAQVNKDSNKIMIDSAKRSLPEAKTFNELEEKIRSGEMLRVRIFDKEEAIAYSEIPKMITFPEQEGSTTIISVLLLGNGPRAIDFIKMILWYCQMDGYQLELNIVDTDSRALEQQLNSACPEVIKLNDDTTDGEAQYSIRFTQKKQLFEILNKEESSVTSDGLLPDRIKRTTTAICALESDDENLELGIKIRTGLLRVQEQQSAEIYVVYENDRSNEIGSAMPASLRTYDEQPYDIKLIGGRKKLYSYGALFNEETEKDSFQYHVLWIDVQEFKDAQDAGKGTKNADKKRELLAQYELHDYYRKSSYAKALHKKAVAQQKQYRCFKYEPNDPHIWLCSCDNCMKRRKVEHRRWNAYMRTQGYQYGEKRIPVAKLHPDLVPFSKLDKEEQMKDS